MPVARDESAAVVSIREDRTGPGRNLRRSDSRAPSADNLKVRITM